MEVDIIFKIAGIGIITAVLHSILKESESRNLPSSQPLQVLLYAS